MRNRAGVCGDSVPLNPKCDHYVGQDRMQLWIAPLFFDKHDIMAISADSC